MARRPHPLVAELRHERIRRGLTQAQVAARIHYLPKSIGGYEKGHSAPSVVALAEWAGALGYELALYRPVQAVAHRELSPETAELMQQVIHLLATACGVSQGEDDE